ncbi:MAG TPA: molybdopterin-dependent oxidoreductase [Candidatus Limnocylindrales bacterium]
MSTSSTRPDPPTDPGPRPARPGVFERLARRWRATWPAALAGLVAGAAAIAVGELIAGVVRDAPSLVTAVGSLVIALQPSGAKELMVNLFGTNDKLVLNLGVLLGALAIALITGVVAGRRFSNGAWIFVGFGVLGAFASFEQPLTSRLFAFVVPVLAVTVGLAVLYGLLALVQGSSVEASRTNAGSRRQSGRDLEERPVWRPTETAAARRAAVVRSASRSTSNPSAPRRKVRKAGGTARDAVTSSSPEWTRRRFLIASASTLGAAVVVGAAGRSLVNDQHPTGAVSTSRLPAVLNPVPPLTAAESFTVPGITPIVMPNNQFYKIDTTLLTPQVDANAWQLDVKGMVNHPLSFTYDELLAMPLFEQYVTIACVSNDVAQDNQPGLNLVGNALWTGVKLKDVLNNAGIQAGATQVVGRSVDDFTVGFPTDWAMAEGREPMIAVGMNGVPLPADHGFPARLIVPGLFGYVSATKWLASIELTTRDAVDGYWIPLGWAKDGPILTQSRIDVPQGGANLPEGRVNLAGVAWAPDRGIEGVEVSIDGGSWAPAQISQPISKATWVQWLLPWTATKGPHSIEVRATDGTGEVQTAEHSDPAPDGARGHHRITVTVG